jgi:hypothetical protein
MMNLRRKKVGSALPFGSAIDSGIETLFKKDVDQAKESFLNKWNNIEINKKPITKNFDRYIRFYKSDLDPNMFNEDELRDESIYHEHESLKRKGLMFIEAFNDQIKPLIKEVISTQEPIEVTKEDGDKIIGYIDLIAKWTDGKKRISDVKTASQAYKEDVLETSEQLAIYDFAKKDMKIDEVGYLVINKQIRKLKEPKVKIQMINGHISEELLKSTINNFDNVLYSIKQGQFPSNNPNCFMYGEECTCQLFDREGYEAFDYVGKDK